MKIRTCFLVWAGLGLALVVRAAQPGFRAQLIGATLAGASAKSSARLDLTSADVLLVHYRKSNLSVAYKKISIIEYGQHVARRYAAAVLVSPVLILSKSRKHYVTIQYSDIDGKQQALVFRVEKGDIRSVLAGLEARTGLRTEYQDDEARKAGKG